MPEPTLGELLVRAGLLSDDQVGVALRGQRGAGLPLEHYLVRSGMLSEEALLGVLTAALGIPALNLDGLAIHDDALKKVPVEYARANSVIPYRLEGRTLFVATADPTREDVVDHLRRAASCEVQLALVTTSAIDRALERAFGRAAAAPDEGLEPRIARLEAQLSTLRDRLVGLGLIEPDAVPPA